jgi:hypothetical protein
MISKLSRVFCGGFILLSSGCNLEHHAPLRSAELPPLAPSVLHANRLWIDVAERMPENACVAPGNARLLCFEHFRSTLGKALTRSLWSSFPGVGIAGSQAPLDGDYVLHVDLDLEALPPDANGPGWSAGTRGSWRLERAGMAKNESLAGEQVASRSRGDFAYGAALGIGASEVIDAVAVRIGMALGAVPESRTVEPVPLPEVATAPLPPPSASVTTKTAQPASLAKPADGVLRKTSSL